jgi:hypothetical protein
MTDKPLNLLGRPIGDRDVALFVESFAHTLRLSVNPDLPERRYFVGDSGEIELLADEHENIQVIFLYLGGYKGHRPYRGPLPFGLHVGMSQEEVRATLGVPQFERPAAEVKYLGRFGPIERYDHGRHSLHFQYSEAHGGIEQVTLSVAAAVPESGNLH